MESPSCKADIQISSLYELHILQHQILIIIFTSQSSCSFSSVSWYRSQENVFKCDAVS